MRVNIIILAAAVATFVSCKKETIERPEEKSAAIGFVTCFMQENNLEQGALARGYEINNAADVATRGGFDVWAYSYTGTWSSLPTTTGLFVETNVTSSDGGLTWDYGTPQKWPPGKSVSFFAYAPHGAATPNGFDAQGVPKISYEVPANVGSHIDLLIADQRTDLSGPDPVDEQFSHALSRIRFSAAKAGYSANNVIITSIEVSTIQYSGSASLKLPVVWTPTPATPATRDYTLSTGNGLLRNDISLTTTMQDVLTTGQTMFMMPQTMDAAARITVSFSVDGLNLSWTAPLPAPVTWLPGKSYNYQLVVDGEMVIVMCAQLESPTDGTWGEY